MTASLKDFANYTRPRPKQFLFYTICLEFVAWVALLDFSIHVISDIRVIMGMVSNTDGVRFPYVYFLFLFVTLRRLSKRYKINSKKMLLTDTREPILYLRAFYEEFNPRVIYHDKVRTDETLAKILKNVGPLVAAGKPSDKLQPVGAIRVYFNDDEWQENVKSLMDISKLVIIQAGHSPSLEWEIVTGVKYLKPQQLLFTFLSWQELEKASRQSEFKKFAAQLKLISNIELPQLDDGAFFLYFDSEWNPHFVSSIGWKRYFFNLIPLLCGLLLPTPRGTFHNLNRFVQIHGIFRKTSVTSVREALRPVLRTEGIRLPVLETIFNISFALGIIFYLIIVFLGLIYLLFLGLIYLLI
jgi:hypothetical protein